MPLELKGLDFKIEWNGDRVLAEVIEKAKYAIGNGAQRIAEKAKMVVPIDTGHLYDNILSTAAEVEGETVTAQVYTDTARYHSKQYGYGGFVELGTVRNRAQPYIMPAAIVIGPTIPAEMRL